MYMHSSMTFKDIRFQKINVVLYWLLKKGKKGSRPQFK